jgi:hypothetical protein
MASMLVEFVEVVGQVSVFSIYYKSSISEMEVEDKV